MPFGSSGNQIFTYGGFHWISTCRGRAITSVQPEAWIEKILGEWCKQATNKVIKMIINVVKRCWSALNQSYPPWAMWGGWIPSLPVAGGPRWVNRGHLLQEIALWGLTHLGHLGHLGVKESIFQKYPIPTPIGNEGNTQLQKSISRDPLTTGKKWGGGWLHG